MNMNSEVQRIDTTDSKWWIVIFDDWEEQPKLYLSDVVWILSDKEIHNVISDLEEIRIRRSDDAIHPWIAFIKWLVAFVRWKPYHPETYYQSCTRSIMNLSNELNRRNGRTTQESIESLKARIPIKQIAERYVGQKNFRHNIRCCLPWHEDSSASLHIGEDKNMFYCFGCHRWWSQIDFIKEMEKCDLKSAIKIFTTYW